ncbi:hypothetical protein PM082_016713 [Marasmius tenuissimus]|nr:hypothetical protein PM082_016713 [Marasmius tenuissimus]
MSSVSSLVQLVCRTSPEELPLPDVIQTAAGAQAVNRSSVASLAFLLYDICLTFDVEVELFWPRKWTFMKLNFFFVRYIPLLVQIPLLFVGTELSPYFHFTDHDCFIWQVYQGVASVCIIMSCDYILLARIYALYYHSPRIRYLVSVAYVLEIAMMSAGLALALPGIHYDEKCTVIFVPESLIVYAGGAVIFQTLLFGLTLYKFLAGIREGWRDIPVVKLLMRDGTWAFFLLFIELVAEVSLYGPKNHAYAGVLYAWLLTVYSVCALDEGTDEEKNSDADGKEGPKRKGKANAKAGASSSDKTSEAPAQKKQRTENAQANKPGSFEAAKNAPTATNAAAKNTAKPTQDVNADIHVPITTPTTPSFTGGAFDIYAMQLPFLQKALKRTSSSKENYAALHTKILEYQAKPDNSGQIAISVPSNTSTNGYGRLSSGMFTDPMEDERYEIGLASLKRHPELKFTAKEKKLFFPDDANTILKGEGISATLVLEEDMCTISGISGELKMSTVPVWKGGEGDNDGVLYQGVVSFSVRYSGLLSRKGHGSGADLSVGLWLVPSKETKRLDCDGVEHLAKSLRKNNRVAEGRILLAFSWSIIIYNSS